MMGVGCLRTGMIFYKSDPKAWGVLEQYFDNI